MITCKSHKKFSISDLKFALPKNHCTTHSCYYGNTLLLAFEFGLQCDNFTQTTGIQKRDTLHSPFFSGLGTREVCFECARLLGHSQISYRDVTNEMKSVVIWNEAP